MAILGYLAPRFLASIIVFFPVLGSISGCSPRFTYLVLFFFVKRKFVAYSKIILHREVFIWQLNNLRFLRSPARQQGTGAAFGRGGGGSLDEIKKRHGDWMT